MNFKFDINFNDIDNFNSNYKNLLNNINKEGNILENDEYIRLNKSINSILNDLNYMTGGSKNLDITLYYAKWCGACKNFKPTWEKIKKVYKDNEKIKLYDYEESVMTNDQLNQVKYYPTILFNNEIYEKSRDFDTFSKEIEKNIN